MGGVPRLRRDLHGGLEVSLDPELPDSYLGCLGLELGEDRGELRSDPLGKVGRHAGTQADPDHLGVLFPIRTAFVGELLRQGHLVDGVQDLLERGVRAHEGVASRDEDVPELGVLREVFHQLVELLGPRRPRLHLLQVEVEPPELEAVHPLTR